RALRGRLLLLMRLPGCEPQLRRSLTGSAATADKAAVSTNAKWLSSGSSPASMSFSICAIVMLSSPDHEHDILAEFFGDREQAYCVSFRAGHQASRNSSRPSMRQARINARLSADADAVEARAEVVEPTDRSSTQQRTSALPCGCPVGGPTPPPRVPPESAGQDARHDRRRRAEALERQMLRIRSDPPVQCRQHVQRVRVPPPVSDRTARQVRGPPREDLYDQPHVAIPRPEQ